MENCTVQWVIIGVCILITLAGLWLAVYRELRNIQKGEKDIQTLIYDKEKGVFNFAFAIGIVLLGGGLYAAIYTVQNDIGCTKTIVDTVKKEVPVGRLLFKLEYSSSPEELRLCQQKPTFKYRNIKKQEEGYFDEYINVPKQNEEFVSYFVKTVHNSEYSTNATERPLKICFTRNEKEIRSDHVLAILIAGNDLKFKPDIGDPGCINLCDPGQTGSVISFSLFPVAYAQPDQAGKKNYGWTVPNLQTLKEKKKTGFSEVIIRSISLNPKLKESNLYYYSIKVNNTPIYIDGLLPEYMKYQFSFERGVNLDFGLENLGFSGISKGYEKIEVSVYFYRDSKFISSITLPLEYVALRNSEPKEITASDGSKFNWEALFKANRENQIFVLSTTSVQEVLSSKNRIDSRSFFFKGNKVVGVIRPPYKDNNNYGLCVGVILSNKQVKFTFDNSEANEFVTYLTSNKYKPLKRQLKDN
jgi:hypothetical protein